MVIIAVLIGGGGSSFTNCQATPGLECSDIIRCKTRYSVNRKDAGRRSAYVCLWEGGREEEGLAPKLEIVVVLKATASCARSEWQFL